MSHQEYVHLELNQLHEENEEIHVTIPPKKTAACRQRVIKHLSPRAELLPKQPTDQAILKSIQESCERQELLLNKAL